MKPQKRFTVTNPSIVFWLCLFIVAFFIVLIILNTVFSEQSPIVMCICVTIFIFIPCICAMMWSKVSKITVQEGKITVRRWTGIKFSFDVKDITNVYWKNVQTKMGIFESIMIKTKHGKKLSVGALMDGFEEMLAYIEANVEQDKIKKTYKTVK